MTPTNPTTRTVAGVAGQAIALVVSLVALRWGNNLAGSVQAVLVAFYPVLAAVQLHGTHLRAAAHTHATGAVAAAKIHAAAYDTAAAGPSPIETMGEMLAAIGGIGANTPTSTNTGS